MKRKSKREMVLDIYDQEAMGEVTPAEIELINRRLVEEYGEGGSMTPAEIARVLVDEDLPVRLDEIFRMGAPSDSYQELFEGLAFSKSLPQAEAAIRRIDSLFRSFAAKPDKTGVRLARRTAMRAKDNALALSRNPDLAPPRRAEQQEIAQWFSIWLQTPDLFGQWLELRKKSPEFRERFGGES